MSYVGDRDPEDGVDPCDHGCGNIATVAHADGRLLCRACYDVETTSGDGAPGCPTCHPEEVPS